MLDLVAAQDGKIPAHDRQIVRVSFPPGTTMGGVLSARYAVPRVTLAAKHGVTVLGSPQPLDHTNLRVVLFNSGTDTFRYRKGHPLAHAVSLAVA